VKQELIERLRQNEGKVVKINCLDGELLEAKIIHVDDEHRDVIYDLLATTTPEKYKQGTPSAYVIHWDDIVDFQ
jgi:acetylglutamate kinase